MMELVRCFQCGASEFIEMGDATQCQYCGSRFSRAAVGVSDVSIDLDSDVEQLLEKCRVDPVNRRRYANLILDIDPTNRDALQYLN